MFVGMTYAMTYFPLNPNGLMFCQRSIIDADLWGCSVYLLSAVRCHGARYESTAHGAVALSARVALNDSQFLGYGENS